MTPVRYSVATLNRCAVLNPPRRRFTLSLTGKIQLISIGYVVTHFALFQACTFLKGRATLHDDVYRSKHFDSRIPEAFCVTAEAPSILYLDLRIHSIASVYRLSEWYVGGVLVCSFVPRSGVDRFGDAFDPRRRKQIAAGVKLDLPSIKSQLTAAVFELDRDNLTVPDPIDPAFSRLAGLQRSRGLRFSLNTAPLPGISLTIAYNHLVSAKFVNDRRFAGNGIPNAPEHAFGMFLRYQLRAPEALVLNMGLSHVGKRFGMSNSSFTLPSYSLLDAGARYSLNRHVELSLNVQNLFDENFYTGSINSTTKFS